MRKEVPRDLGVVGVVETHGPADHVQVVVSARTDRIGTVCFWNVDAKVKPYLPTQYVDKQFWISDEWYAENGNKAVELWNAWMLKKA